MSNEETEKFKSSPLGFLMSVMAKYQAYMQENYETSGNKEVDTKARNAGEMLDNLKIELSKTENLKKEVSNEAVLMHVLENCEKEEQNTILECIFEYLNLLDNVMQNIDSESPDSKDLMNEYYDVSRLGLILNCYLGEFDNDDFFYGTLAEIAEVIKVPELSELLISKIEKADIDLAFKVFLKEIYAEISEEHKKVLYEDMLRTYADSLLNKVLSQEVGQEEIGRLACAKQIQRIYEKLIVEKEL